MDGDKKCLEDALSDLYRNLNIVNGTATRGNFDPIETKIARIQH